MPFGPGDDRGPACGSPTEQRTLALSANCSVLAPSVRFNRTTASLFCLNMAASPKVRYSIAFNALRSASPVRRGVALGGWQPGRIMATRPDRGHGIPRPPSCKCKTPQPAKSFIPCASIAIHSLRRCLSQELILYWPLTLIAGTSSHGQAWKRASGKPGVEWRRSLSIGYLLLPMVNPNS